VIGTNLLLRVSDSLFNIAQLLKYMELGQCCLPGSAASFEKFSEALRLTERCETTPYAGISG
jgi:hypothetical protein